MYSCLVIIFLVHVWVSVTYVSFNVLVDESCIGQSKAKCVCSFLQELNDAVKAKFIEENPEELIKTNPSFFSQFTLVVATQVYFYL